jgi:hypothetical protein
MKDLNKVLNTVLIFISVLLLYLVYSGNSKLNEAVKIINNVNDSILVVKDSLQNARNSIQIVLKKLEFTDNELKLLKAERNLLELEEQKKQAKNWEELQLYKVKIKKMEGKKDSLKQDAEKYEL